MSTLCGSPGVVRSTMPPARPALAVVHPGHGERGRLQVADVDRGGVQGADHGPLQRPGGAGAVAGGETVSPFFRVVA